MSNFENSANANREAHRAPMQPNPMALKLGYGGLLPFVLGAALIWIVRADAHAYVAESLSAYTAVILSFLGGIHWGLAMSLDRDSGGPSGAQTAAQNSAPKQAAPTSMYVWGVLPSLVAWVAVIMPAYAGLVIQGLGLVICYLVDRKVYPRCGASAWLTLRFRLTVVASLSCFFGAAGS